MSKTKIIEIESFREATPIDNTWYRYGDELFFSIIGCTGRKPHLRSKTLVVSNRKDSVLSDWHRDWQYNQIEYYYGLKVGASKTFEICIEHENERHIIDSLVDNISIEFQHTLSVPVCEMNKRFLAHEFLGYLPYLVLDFTHHKIPNELYRETIYNIESLKNLTLSWRSLGLDHQLWQKMIKWITSLYFTSGNLFIEFNDGLARFHPNLLKCIILSKEEFVQNLKEQEIRLAYQLEEDKIIKVRRNEKEKARMESLSLREEQDRIEKLERELKEREESKKRAIENNNRAKYNNVEYARFRDIIKNPLISPFLKEIRLNEFIFEADIENKREGNFYRKNYIYLCKNEDILFQYITTTIVGHYSSGVEFVSSEIKISRRKNYEIRTFTFLKEKNKKWLLTEARSELAIGFLHCFKYPSLIKYNEAGEKILKQWYLFNRKIDEDIFSLVSEYYQIFRVIENNKDQLTSEQFERLKLVSMNIDNERDDYFFIENTISYHGIMAADFKRYYRDESVVFESHLLKQFYIKDL